VVYVVWDEERQAGVDATLLEVLLEQDLEVLVQVVEGRSGVESPPRPVLLSRLGIGQVGRGEVVEVLDEEVAILGGCLDGKSALARSLDADAGVGGEALLLAVLLVVLLKLLAVGRRDAVLGRDADVSVLGLALVDGTLGVGATRLHVHVGVVKGSVLDRVRVGQVVVQVGRGEGQTDLLVAKGAGQDHLLVAGLVFHLMSHELMWIRSCWRVSYLEGAVLEVLLDVRGQIVVFLHVLLHGDLALELCDKLIADCDTVSRILCAFSNSTCQLRSLVSVLRRGKQL
jgi:hypothetical protein